jgi:hypothetical protein
MAIVTIKNDLIAKLLEMGYRVLYLKDSGRYFLIETFDHHDPDNFIHFNKLKGKDITFLIENFQSNFNDKNLLNSRINSTPTLSMKFSAAEQYYLYEDLN